MMRIEDVLLDEADATEVFRPAQTVEGTAKDEAKILNATKKCSTS